MVDVLLLELEGVLVDTHAARLASLREACASRGVDASHAELEPGTAVRTSVLGAMTAAGQPADDVLADLMALDAERAFSRGLSVGGVALQPWARQFMDRATASVRLAIVTRVRRADTDAILRLSGLAGAFACIVTCDDIFDPKPSPAGMQLALDRLARQRPVVHTAVLALEDGTDGIRAARSAFVRSVAVGAIPPHAAIEADAYVASLDGHTPASLDALSAPGRERVQ
ncbi:MAG: HAD hydrolase-like protein [Gemmatimonadaceae bacterium]